MSIRRLPLRFALPAYIVAVLVLAAGLSALAIATAPSQPLSSSAGVSLAVFAVCVVLGELRPQRWLSLVDGGEVTATWTFAFAMVFLAPAPWPMLLMGGAIAVAEVAQRKPLARVVFNTAQIVAAVSLGDLVFEATADRSDLLVDRHASPGWLVAALLASAVAVGANNVMTCGVLALHQGAPLRRIVRDSLDVNLMMDGLLVALGPVFALVAVTGSALLPLLLATVVVIHLSGSLALKNRHDATHDQLTGLPNRRNFGAQAEARLEAAFRQGRSIAIVQVDLDGFKEINDRLGHHYGDLALREVADRLAAGKRPNDLVARFGGDEFAILLSDVGDEEGAVLLAAALHESVCRQLTLDGVVVPIGASFGLSLFPAHGADLLTLLHRADQAMYEAKTATGGLRVYDATAAVPAISRSALVADLAAALERDELFLLYQPRVCLRTGQVDAVEALVRWRHPELGVLGPAVFMPIIEQSDLVVAVTERIARMAVEQCAEWYREGRSLIVAINASARNLDDRHFPSMLADLVSKAGLPACRIELEITEHSVMTEPLRASGMIRQLREQGVRVAVDDFGTGYSSLTTLRDLTVDWLKIDRSFVFEMDRRPGNLAIVRSVIDLARNLGIRSVAEGVETCEELDLLVELGCDAVQGYYLGRPMEA
ncbi:MAG: EAL domain-containing protein, partial [Acidimicrobiia bacterium]|nr:EAL domain-containing protein [Acidimicrobiia bacterium]